MMLIDKFPATFRRVDGSAEIVIEMDSDIPSPLDDTEVFEFVGISRRDRIVGQRQVDSDTLAEIIKEARERGDLTFTVYCFFDHIVRYSLLRTNQSRDRAGTVVVNRAVMENADFTEETVVKHIDGLLESYSDWCNGEAYGFEEWRIRQCNLGGFHRVDEHARDGCWGYLGDTGMKALIVEQGLVTDDDPDTLSSEWVAVETTARR